MQESFLHFIWRTRRFSHQHLFTTTLQPVEILDPGVYNTNAGPDFFNARIRMGDAVWVGNVEMHVRASEWMAHGHQHDPAYSSVILHVVWLEDRPVFLENQIALPCLELRGRVDMVLLQRYKNLETNKLWIPCAAQINQAPLVIRLNCLDRMLVERLEEKTELVAQVLEANNQNWDEAFYQLLAGGFGLRINTQAFESVARSLPALILARHRDQLFQLEALLFGQSGFLSGNFSDAYPIALQREYQHLALKYQLSPLSVQVWKFARLRPAGFPTLRLAQFAALWSRSERLFSQALEIEDLKSLGYLFSADVSEYWKTHYRFEKKSRRLPRRPGRAFLETLALNVIVPMMYYYGKIKYQSVYQNRALHLLDCLLPEKNQIQSAWARLGMSAQNAGESQALLQLKTRYCDARRCLQCTIGCFILEGKSTGF